MAQRAVEWGIPFIQLLKRVDELSPNKKLILYKHLEREKVLSWKERFGKVLDYLGERNKEIPLEKVELDVARAVKEVRGRYGGN